MNFTCANSVGNKVMWRVRFDFTMRQVHPEVYYHGQVWWAVPQVESQISEQVYIHHNPIKNKITQEIIK
jgi:hypothetical protein